MLSRRRGPLRAILKQGSVRLMARLAGMSLGTYYGRSNLAAGMLSRRRGPLRAILKQGSVRLMARLAGMSLGTYYGRSNVAAGMLSRRQGPLRAILEQGSVRLMARLAYSSLGIGNSSIFRSMVRNALARARAAIMTTSVPTVAHE